MSATRKSPKKATRRTTPRRRSATGSRRASSTTRRRTSSRTRRARPKVATTVGAALGTLVVTLLLDASWPVRVGLVLLALVLVGGYLFLQGRRHDAAAVDPPNSTPPPATPLTSTPSPSTAPTSPPPPPEDLR